VTVNGGLLNLNSVNQNLGTLSLGNGSITGLATLGLNSLNYTATSGFNQIGALTGQGTLNFSGSNAGLSLATRNKTLTIGSVRGHQTNMVITNGANLIIGSTNANPSWGIVNNDQSLTITGSGTTTLMATNGIAFTGVERGQPDHHQHHDDLYQRWLWRGRLRF